jgi:hypothetical protein
MAGPHLILQIFRRFQQRHPLIEQRPGVSEPQTRVERSSRVTPSSFSSCLTLKLTTALVCPSAAAAG